MQQQATCQHTPGLVHEFLDKTALRLPDKYAIIADEGTVTYRQLMEESSRLASWFYQAGVRRGDRVALLLPNGIPLVTALMATSRLGAIFFVVNQAIKSYNLRYILDDATPALIVTSKQRDEEEHLTAYSRVFLWENDWEAALQCTLYDLPFPGISHDPACLIYTSGSTGRPKAVISSHRNIVFAAYAIQQSLGYQESDIIGNFLPLAFDVGLYQIFLSFQVGATLALGRDVHVGPLLLKKLSEWQITGLPAVPSLVSTLIRLAKRTHDRLPYLRFITNTGAHLPQAYIQDVQKLFTGCSVFVMFGLTECKRVSILPPSEYERKGSSVGKPLIDTECLIVDSDGQVLPAGESGELVVRGPHVMLGYWRAPELTARRFRTWGPGMERVLFTGDTCTMDTEGYLYFHGRSDDIYKQGGYRVSALEIEAAAHDIHGVRLVALLPPSEGKEAVLFIAGEIASDVVLEELRQRLEDYKIPPKICVIDDFPLTSNGKIDKKQLYVQLLKEV